MIYDNILQVVGRTPTVRLNRIGADTGVELYAKCEFLNPGGSVKDRIAVRMVEGLEESGRIDDLRVAAARQKDALLVQNLDRQIERMEAIEANGRKTKRWIAALASASPDIRLLAYEMLGRSGSQQAARALAETFPRVEPTEGVQVQCAIQELVPA